MTLQQNFAAYPNSCAALSPSRLPPSICVFTTLSCILSARGNPFFCVMGLSPATVTIPSPTMRGLPGVCCGAHQPINCRTAPDLDMFDIAPLHVLGQS
eukprot:scaffold15022_cov117-Isochrysis_galbana.AAC.15